MDFISTPDIVYGRLFEEVQLSGIFEDSKTFVDCIPLRDPAQIMAAYERERSLPGFDLETFVRRFFELPGTSQDAYQSDRTKSASEHIKALWDKLLRDQDEVQKGSSLIPLPKPYIVPGGRFREIYYWDSYFTMLGLARSGRWKVVESMIENFSYLIREFGHIPNGNRTYFLSRSQPPFFALMVQLLADERGPKILLRYLPVLEKEYAFWMDGSLKLNSNMRAYRRVVQVPDGSVMNRYFDDLPIPRQESFQEDYLLQKRAGSDPIELYRNLRAACESGWDFSSRWFADESDLSSIRTTELVPIDLNVLLYILEETLKEAYEAKGDHDLSDQMTERSQIRRKSINHYCWNDRINYYTDYDFVHEEPAQSIHAAGIFPLFAGLADEIQARHCIQMIEEKLLAAGGVRTTTIHSGQQWDAPNGWAPLQWITVKALERYGAHDLATKVKDRWLHLNERVFKSTGKMLEKYNVDDVSLEAGGGEYPVQDGFGWTNGVFLSLKE